MLANSSLACTAISFGFGTATWRAEETCLMSAPVVSRCGKAARRHAYYRHLIADVVATVRAA